jgi:hemolysin-activating ACP:hemolysin acyltransferase
MNSGTQGKGASEKASSKPNGTSQAKAPAAKKPHPREARQARLTQAFADVVAVLMRDRQFGQFKIADLQWLILPALLSGQFRVAHTKATGAEAKARGSDVVVPCAVAIWATVSPELDKALSSEGNQRWLRPNQWASGDITWLMAVAGDPRVVPTFVKQLAETQFKGKQVKWRTQDADGKPVVKTLGASA